MMNIVTDLDNEPLAKLFFFVQKYQELFHSRVTTNELMLMDFYRLESLDMAKTRKNGDKHI